MCLTSERACLQDYIIEVQSWNILYIHTLIGVIYVYLWIYAKNPNRFESTVCLRDWGQQLTMRRQQSCKLQAASCKHFAHECILISYGCRALHTHAHTLHRESGEHTAKSSSRVDKVRTSTKLQLISDALRRQHTGRTYYRTEVHTRTHTDWHMCSLYGHRGSLW